jgi:4-amino-4-deoxy-L-arabinose transferase-like glycosyltransferase
MTVRAPSLTTPDSVQRRWLGVGSPSGEPRWARMALLFVTALAGVAYGLRMGSTIEIFYAASVRSMATSWHDFLFAVLDPAGTVSVDKLPGALWIQALSVRIFGVHTWAIGLPQVVEGALTVLLTYRLVRRLAGPGASLIAAGLVGLAPATVSFDRGNISDTLFVLLMVVAADSVVVAVQTGRFRHLVVAGVWVGLAFQAKMLEAWLLLPALVLAYLVASRVPLRPRIGQLLGMVGISVVVSLSWMTFVSLTPASQRPYVDGSTDNSIFAQVFEYNGFGRVGALSPNQELGKTLRIPYLERPVPTASWDRLFRGTYGHDTGWLLPAALVLVPVELLAVRHRPRTDVLRAGVVLFGTWLVVLLVVFSATAINPYYLGALSVPIGVLVAVGAGLALQHRSVPVTKLIVAVVGLGTTAYAWWLMPSGGTGVVGWLGPLALVLGVLGAAGVLVTFVERVRRLRISSAVALGTLAVGSLLAPTTASASVVVKDLGAFDTPFQAVATTRFLDSFFSAPLDVAGLVPRLEKVRNGAPDLMAVQSSVLASPFIFATGQEVLPIGGYTGTEPEPSVSDLEKMVAKGNFHLVLAPMGSRLPQVVWIRRHCLRLNATKATAVIGPLRVFYCSPNDAR